MTPKQLKILLLEKDLTVTELAQKCERRLKKPIYREQVSMCIHRYRHYPSLRKAIADELHTTVEVLFNNCPAKSVT